MNETRSLADTADPSTQKALKIRLCVMMFLQYFIQGSYLPIIPLYLEKALNFSPMQIGNFASAIAIGPLFAPFIIGQIVDRHFSTEKVLAVCHFSGGAIMLSLYFQTDFRNIMILGAIYSALYMPSLMLTNSLTFHHLVDSDREFPLIRLWGTIGFVVPAWIVEMFLLRNLSGAELDQERGVVLILAGVSGLLMGAYSLTLPHTPPSSSDKKDLAPGKVLGLMRHRHFLVLILVSFIVAVAHKFFFTWNSPFLKDILAIGDVQSAWEQRISSVGQIFEVVVMTFLGFMVKRFGFKITMLVGIFAYLARFVIFTMAVMIDQQFAVSISLVVFGQALHGFCFGCFLAAAYMYVDGAAPVDVRGSMQTFYGTFVIGVGFLFGGYFSGLVAGSFTVNYEADVIRSRIGIETEAGLIATSVTDENDQPVLLPDGSQKMIYRDWPAIWMAGAALAALAFVAFAIFFPKHAVDEEDVDDSDEAQSEAAADSTGA